MSEDARAAPRGRVLFVLTSHDRLGDTGRATGYYLSEVSHPHRVFVLSLIHISEPTRRATISRMPSSA